MRVELEQFANIVPALARDVEPMLRDRAQPTSMLLQPGLDGRIPLD